MAEKFNWIRLGYELVELKFEWNVQVPFLQNTNDLNQNLASPFFPTPDNPNSIFKLILQDDAEKIIIRTYHYNNSAGTCVYFVEPVQVKLLILNKEGTKVLQQMLSSTSTPKSYFVEFRISIKDIIESKCQQSDGSLTFCCKIFTHVKKESVSSSADPPVLTIDCTAGLSSHLEELFNNMSLSDVSFNIRGHEFPAHKNILAARSEVFAAMFKHPMKEQSTNQIKVEDIDPEVFQQLIRFIYTGRMSTATMETMAAGLFIAADKYLMDDLKMKCQTYLLHHMSPDNCVVLLLHGDLLNPAEPLKKAAKFLRRFPNQVTATERWKKMKQEDPAVLCEIQQFVLCFK